MGDSITARAGEGRLGGGVWAELFGNISAAPLGVSGNTVEQLSSRLMEGAERFDAAHAPRVAVRGRLGGGSSRPAPLPAAAPGACPASADAARPSLLNV